MKPNITGSMPLKLNINNLEITRVSDISGKFNIKEEEVSHIFVNSRYSGFTKKVNEGEVIALFPRNMAVLYKWYFNREEDE